MAPVVERLGPSRALSCNVVASRCRAVVATASSHSACHSANHPSFSAVRRAGERAKLQEELEERERRHELELEQLRVDAEEARAALRCGAFVCVASHACQSSPLLCLAPRCVCDSAMLEHERAQQQQADATRIAELEANMTRVVQEAEERVRGFRERVRD